MSLRRACLFLCLAALILRLPDVGNPMVDYDEQMYLLVGRRMWDGLIPYVDIWDRKPIGLFLIYAATQAFGGDPVVAYHLAALAAAAATACILAVLSIRLGYARAAPWAGLVYLVWLELVGGRGGQSPVFYNLPIAAAAWATLAAMERDRRRFGIVAMLLVGVALQIKPTTLFEGGAFGIALLIARFRRDAPLRLAGYAGMLIGTALLPTVVAFGAYAAMGHADAWWFANVRSIFLRTVNPTDPVAARVLATGLILLVPIAVSLYGAATARGPVRLMIAGWLAAAGIGWLLVPPYIAHYSLPLILPIALAAGMAMGRSRLFATATIVSGAALLLLSGYPHRGETGDARRAIAQLAQMVSANSGGDCPYVYLGPPAIYTAAGACLPTRWPFSEHLGNVSEARAIGTDPRAEVERILSRRPPVIVTRAITPADNQATALPVRRALAAHYRPIGDRLGYTVYARAN